MEDQSLGTVNITVDVIGHDTASNTIVLQLPSGAIVPAIVARGNFSKHIIPLLENPPKKVFRAQPIEVLPQEQPETTVQEVKSVAEPEEKIEMDDIWWDVDGMFQEIRWHAKKNGRSIVLDERHIQPPRIAFKCLTTDKSWSLDLKCLNDYCDKLFNSQDTASQSKGFQLRKCISTHEGKERLVESLNNAIK